MNERTVAASLTTMPPGVWAIRGRHRYFHPPLANLIYRESISISQQFDGGASLQYISPRLPLANRAGSRARGEI